jgi:hypothetical protein
MRKRKGGNNRYDRVANQNNFDFTDWAPKIDLEDEYFGGFRPTAEDFGAKSRRDGRHCSDGEFSRSGRGPKGWAAETGWGLVDGQTSSMHEHLTTRDHWPKWRKVKHQPATSNQVNFPFAHQAIRQAQQTLPLVDPVKDRRESLDGLAGLPADPPFTPRGILHAERAQLYAQHTERRIQALYCRQFKPSKKLELRRMPVLKRVNKSPLLTKIYLVRESGDVRAAKRPELEGLVAAYLAGGGGVRLCPPEMTAQQVAKLKKAPPLVVRERRKAGRKPLFGVKMTDAERQRRSRRNKRLQALVAPERRQAGAVQPRPLADGAGRSFEERK